MLSNEDIVLEIRSGKRELIGELYERNLALLRILSRPYIKAGMEPDDVLQEGYFAILDALEKYDPERGSFSTFLRYSVKIVIGKAFRTSLYSKRIPENIQALIIKYNKLISEYSAENGSPPNDYYLRFFLGINQTQLDDLRVTIEQSKEVSIYQTIPGTEDITTLDTIQDPADIIEAAIDRVDEEQARRELWQAVGTLPAEQAEIIKTRYAEGKTIKETAELQRMTPGRARQAEEKALRSLRRKRTVKQIGERFGYYSTRALYGGSLQSFKRTFTSQVEETAIRHVEGSETKSTL